jgi:hypothetical protein
MGGTAVVHPLVAGYLRQFDAAASVLPVHRMQPVSPHSFLRLSLRLSQQTAGRRPRAWPLARDHRQAVGRGEAAALVTAQGVVPDFYHRRGISRAVAF